MPEITATHLERYGIARRQARPELWMALRDRGHVQILFEKGGFQDGRVVQKSTGYPLQSADEWWGFMWSGASQKELRQLPPASLERVKGEILDEIDTLRTCEGIWLDASAFIGIGVRA